MTRKKIIRRWNDHFHPSEVDHLETIPGDSKTIKGEAYTIQELFARTSSGLHDTYFDDQVYDEDPDFDDIPMHNIHRMDITEIEEARMALLNREVELKLREKDRSSNQPPENEPQEEASEPSIITENAKPD